MIFHWLVCGWGAPSWALWKVIEACLASQIKEEKFAIPFNKGNIVDSENSVVLVNFKLVKSEGGPLNFSNGDVESVETTANSEVQTEESNKSSRESSS